MQFLKAALDDTLAALAEQPDLAGVLWERLLQAVIVQPLREDTRLVSLARYDISYQLNEIEVRPCIQVDSHKIARERFSAAVILRLALPGIVRLQNVDATIP